MIEVIVNRPSFEYDIHSLVKAFFPREDVSVRVQEAFAEETKLRISLHFTDDKIYIALLEQGEEKQSGSDEICYGDRKETKDRMKRLLYRILQAYTGQSLPWGT